MAAHAGIGLVQVYRASARGEFAGKAREVLADRAEFMRKRVAEYGAMLPAHSIDLGSTARLPESGTIFDAARRRGLGADGWLLIVRP